MKPIAALALVATLLAAPPAALAAPATSDGAAAIQQVEPKPDLTARLARREGGTLEPGESFSLETVVKNEGRGPGKPVRVQIFLDNTFEAVRVTDAPGFSCTIEHFQDADWFDCKGGQVPAGQDVRIIVDAKASQTPGDYKSLAVVDPKQVVDESNENNNLSNQLPLNVRKRN